MFSNKIIEDQYYVLGYYIDLTFPVHKLGIEIDENGHLHRPEAEEKERQKTIEKETGFKIIRTNPDREDFDDFVEVGRIQNYIIESTKKITKNSAVDDVKKLLKVAFKFKKNDIISKFTRNFELESLAYIVRMKLRTYCLTFRKHTNNIGSKRMTMTNKVIRDESRCGECLSDKSRFMAKEESKNREMKKNTKEYKKEFNKALKRSLKNRR